MVWPACSFKSGVSAVHDRYNSTKTPSGWLPDDKGASSNKAKLVWSFLKQLSCHQMAQAVVSLSLVLGDAPGLLSTDENAEITFVGKGAVDAWTVS